MDEIDDASAAQALTTVISALGRLDEDARRRVLQSVATFFAIGISSTPTVSKPAQTNGGRDDLAFTADRTPSPKAFLMEKQPRTDVERVACLAYYLTHYRNTPYFKTLDLGKLNTEAAQPKFSNAAYASNNALKMGYLVDC